MPPNLDYPTLSQALEASYAAGTSRGLSSGIAMRLEGQRAQQRSALSGLEAWLPASTDLLAGSPFLQSIPRDENAPYGRLGRLYGIGRASRRRTPYDITATMLPRLLQGITQSILEGNAEMPQEALAGRAYGRASQSISEALFNAFREVERHGSRPSQLVVSPRMMPRIFRELAVDPARFSTEGEISIQGSHGEVTVMPDASLPEGLAYLVDPSQLRMAHQGVHPITASAQLDPSADEIEVRLAYAAQVIATNHAAITKLMLEEQYKVVPPDTTMTNNVLPPRRTAWDRINSDFIGEEA